jgi:hypothetical protein
LQLLKDTIELGLKVRWAISCSFASVLGILSGLFVVCGRVRAFVAM